MSQLWHSTCRKTTPAARSAPTLPSLAAGADGGVGADGVVGADGGVGATAASLRLPIVSVLRSLQLPGCTSPSAAAPGTSWSGERNGVWDSLSGQVTLGSVTAGDESMPLDLQRCPSFISLQEFHTCVDRHVIIGFYFFFSFWIEMKSHKALYFASLVTHYQITASPLTCLKYFACFSYISLEPWLAVFAR